MPNTSVLESALWAGKSHMQYVADAASAGESRWLSASAYYERKQRMRNQGVIVPDAPKSTEAGKPSESGSPAPVLTGDKKVSEFDWRDANRVVKEMQRLAQGASASQDFATFPAPDLPAYDGNLHLLPIADWHIGSYAADYDAIERLTDFILTTPNLYVCVLGDMLQMAIKLRGVLEISDNVLPPKLQFRYLETWLRELAKSGKVLFSTWDNHAQMREENATGYSRYADIFSRETVHFNGLGHVTFRVGAEVYKGAVSHVFRGRSINDTCFGQKRYLQREAPTFDFALAADSHVPGLVQYTEGGLLRTCLNCGTLQTASGYAKRFFSLKTWSAFPCLTLRSDRHEITPFWDVQTMMAQK